MNGTVPFPIWVLIIQFVSACASSVRCLSQTCTELRARLLTGPNGPHPMFGVQKRSPRDGYEIVNNGFGPVYDEMISHFNVHELSICGDQFTIYKLWLRGSAEAYRITALSISHIVPDSGRRIFVGGTGVFNNLTSLYIGTSAVHAICGCLRTEAPKLNDLSLALNHSSQLDPALVSLSSLTTLSKVSINIKSADRDPANGTLCFAAPTTLTELRFRVVFDGSKVAVTNMRNCTRLRDLMLDGCRYQTLGHLASVPNGITALTALDCLTVHGFGAAAASCVRNLTVNEREVADEFPLVTHLTLMGMAVLAYAEHRLPWERDVTPAFVKKAELFLQGHLSGYRGVAEALHHPEVFAYHFAYEARNSLQRLTVTCDSSLLDNRPVAMYDDGDEEIDPPIPQTELDTISEMFRGLQIQWYWGE